MPAAPRCWNSSGRWRSSWKNLALLQGKGVVINTNALSWLAGDGQPFDVVFLDPPFRKGLLAETVLLLEQRGWLADEARIYVEAEAESAAADVPASWQLHREKVAGQVAYRLYLRSQEKTDHAD